MCVENVYWGCGIRRPHPPFPCLSPATKLTSVLKTFLWVMLSFEVNWVGKVPGGRAFLTVGLHLWLLFCGMIFYYVCSSIFDFLNSCHGRPNQLEPPPPLPSPHNTFPIQTALISKKEMEVPVMACQCYA